MYVGGRFVGPDEIEDARRDAAYERFLVVAVRCAGCGELHDPGRHAATRTDPAYVEVDECPECGCPDTTDKEQDRAPLSDECRRERALDDLEGVFDEYLEPPDDEAC